MIQKVCADLSRISAWFRRHFGGRLGIPLCGETSIEDGSPNANPLQNISARPAPLEKDPLRATPREDTVTTTDFAKVGSSSGDALRDVPPRPTSPEDDPLETPNTETMFVSSNSKTASNLCGVCSKVPAWFWKQKVEDGDEISVELQPFSEMRAGAQNGCGLCQALCASHDVKNGEKESDDNIQGLGTAKLVKHRRGGGDDIICQFQEVKFLSIEVLPVPSFWSKSLHTSCRVYVHVN